MESSVDLVPKPQQTLQSWEDCSELAIGVRRENLLDFAMLEPSLKR